jgi:hypothetical protein
MAKHRARRSSTRRITHTVLKEKHQVAFCLAHLLLARAGQTSPPRRQNTRCHCCMHEHESVTAACANMSVTASATKFDEVKRLTWATMKLITVCRLGARSVDRRRRRLLKLASLPFKVTRRDSNVINNGRIVASTRNIDDNKQTALANSSNKVKATDTRRRLAHERRSQIARINTALSNYFSGYVLFICTRRRSFRSSHG